MKTLQLVITEECNLSCKYCYMKNKNTVMSREVFLEYHRSLPDSVYRIAFFGGEPLRNWDLIEFVVGYLSTDDRCKGFDIHSNGLLLDNHMVDFILQHNIKFIWSCDGEDTGTLRLGASWEDYIQKKDLLRRGVYDINIMITPDNMSMVRLHRSFVESFGLVPSFRILRDNEWRWDDVRTFRSSFYQYIIYISLHPDEIPIWIYRELENIYKGVDNNVYKEPCIVEMGHDCLMPNGTVHLCAKVAMLGISDEYNPSLYTKCHTCDLNLFCEKQCYETVDRNGGIVDEICELYKIIFDGIIMLDTILEEKGDVKWKRKKDRMVA